MTLREKMRQLIGFTDLEDFDVAYKAIVNEIGLDNLRPLLPITEEAVKTAYAEDKNLNNIPLSKWEKAAGFAVTYNSLRDTEDVHMIAGAPLPALLKQHGIQGISCSQGICLLKTCAKMLAEKGEESSIARGREDV